MASEKEYFFIQFIYVFWPLEPNSDDLLTSDLDFTGQNTLPGLKNSFWTFLSFFFVTVIELR